MKKLDYKKLALMGIAGGALVAAQAHAEISTSPTSSETVVAGGCGGGSKPNGTTKGNGCQSGGCGNKTSTPTKANGSSCASNNGTPKANGNGCASNNGAPKTNGNGCAHKNGNGTPVPAPTDNDTTDGATNATPNGKGTRVSAGCKGGCKSNGTGKGPGKLAPDTDQTAMQTKRANLQGGKH